MSSEMSAGIRGLLMTPARPPTFFAVISHEVGAHCTANSLQPLQGKKFFCRTRNCKSKKKNHLYLESELLRSSWEAQLPHSLPQTNPRNGL